MCLRGLTLQPRPSQGSEKALLVENLVQVNVWRQGLHTKGPMCSARCEASSLPSRPPSIFILGRVAMRVFMNH